MGKTTYGFIRQMFVDDLRVVLYKFEPLFDSCFEIDGCAVCNTRITTGFRFKLQRMTPAHEKDAMEREYTTICQVTFCPDCWRGENAIYFKDRQPMSKEEFDAWRNSV